MLASADRSENKPAWSANKTKPRRISKIRRPHRSAEAHSSHLKEPLVSSLGWLEEAAGETLSGLVPPAQVVVWLCHPMASRAGLRASGVACSGTMMPRSNGRVDPPRYAERPENPIPLAYREHLRCSGRATFFLDSLPPPVHSNRQQHNDWRDKGCCG